MRILLVEDDLEQLEPLHEALSEVGHIVDGAQNGETAQWLLGEKDYDLLILDWMLPDFSGLNLCQQYRHSGKTAPVLILTAKDTILDKVSGLDAGADDYIVKPVDLLELLARVRAWEAIAFMAGGYTKNCRFTTVSNQPNSRTRSGIGATITSRISVTRIFCSSSPSSVKPQSNRTSVVGMGNRTRKQCCIGFCKAIAAAIAVTQSSRLD